LVFEIICQPYIPEMRLRKFFQKIHKTATQNPISLTTSIISLSHAPVGQGWDKRGTRLGQDSGWTVPRMPKTFTSSRPYLYLFLRLPRIKILQNP
jgi:hypothetical protein